MSIQKSYTKDLKNNIGYTATWLPIERLALGDVGTLAGYQFNRQGTLGGFGIQFAPGDPGAEAEFSYTSTSEVTTKVKLAGRAPTNGSVLSEADAGITISFGSAGAAVFIASECTVHAIEDILALKNSILHAFREGNWRRDLVAVTHVVLAASTTVLISKSNNASIDLRAEAGVARPELELINLKGSFNLAGDRHMATKILATGGLTPLFRCIGITGFLRPDVIQKGTDREHNSDVTEVEYVEYDDFDVAG